MIKTKYQLSKKLNVDAKGLAILHRAAQNGKGEIVKLLIDAGADVNGMTRGGRTPLHFAAKHNKIETVRILLEEGADVNATSVRDESPLHIAAHNDNVEMLDLLVEAGADPLALCDYAYAQYDHWEQYSLLMRPNSYGNLSDEEMECSDDYYDGCFRFNILHIAAANNKPGIAARALELGIDINSREQATGCNALHIAVLWRSSPALIEFLLSKGTLNVDKPYRVAYIPVYARHLRKETHRLTALHMACFHHPEAVPVLINAGAKVEAQSSLGYTPLHYLAVYTVYKHHFSSYNEAMKALTSAGADMNAADEDGSTPLHCACQRNNSIAIELLIKAGADVQMQAGQYQSSSAGGTALHFLAQHLDAYALPSQLINIKLLISATVDINAKDNDGNTPLHCLMWPVGQHAGQFGDPISDYELEGYARTLIVRIRWSIFFIRAGADVCARNKKGHTPLQHLHARLSNWRDLIYDPSFREVLLPGGNLSHAIIGNCIALIIAGDFSWDVIPNPCPSLELAVVPLWQKIPEHPELPRLFGRLPEESKAKIRAVIRVLYRTLPLELRMKVLRAVLGVERHRSLF